MSYSLEKRSREHSKSERGSKPDKCHDTMVIPIKGKTCKVNVPICDDIKCKDTTKHVKGVRGHAKPKDAKLGLLVKQGRDEIHVHLDREDYCVDGGKVHVDVGSPQIDIAQQDIDIDVWVDDKACPKVKVTGGEARCHVKEACVTVSQCKPEVHFQCPKFNVKVHQSRCRAESEVMEVSH